MIPPDAKIDDLFGELLQKQKAAIRSNTAYKLLANLNGLFELET